MDEYLKGFLEYLQEKVGEELAGLVIFGSYVAGYFDKNNSDYDVFVVFKSEVPDLKEDIVKKFPRIVTHFYDTVEKLEEKIRFGGWNTYMALIHTGEILFKTSRLEDVTSKFKQPIALKELSDQHKRHLVDKLKDQVNIAKVKEGFELNKFLYSSLLRKLQILYFLRNGEIIFKFNELLEKTEDDFMNDNREWLLQLEELVFSRRESTLYGRDKYFDTISLPDNALAEELGV